MVIKNYVCQVVSSVMSRHSQDYFKIEALSRSLINRLHSNC